MARCSGLIRATPLQSRSLQDFYIIAHEAGAENPEIPTWASTGDNPARLAAAAPRSVQRRNIEAVPGAYQLLGVLDAHECDRLLQLSEGCGYLGDAAVSLGRDIRHNDSFTWVADDTTCDLIWRRCANLIDDASAYNAGKTARGINARFRFYRYGEGDYFAPHTDGSWPGSRIVDGRLLHNAFDDRWSQFSFLLFLSEDYDGGATRFYLDKSDPARAARDPRQAEIVSVRTPRGAALCFPHGMHPQHCLHASEPISRGTKYIIRSDILFDL